MAARFHAVVIAWEALSIARARRLTFAATVLVSFAGVAVPTVISSQTVAEQDRAREALLSVPQRTIVVTDPKWDSQGELDEGFLRQANALLAVEQTLTLGAIRDLKPAAGWPGSQRVPTVTVYADQGADECDSVRLPFTLRRPTLHEATEKAYIPVAGSRSTQSWTLGPDAALAVETKCEFVTARQVVVLVRSPEELNGVAEFLARMTSPAVEVDVPDNIDSLRRSLERGFTHLEQRLRIVSVAGASLLVGVIGALSSSAQTRHNARRRSFGATRSDIMALMLGQSLLPVLIGVVMASCLVVVADGAGFGLKARGLVATSVVVVEASLLPSFCIALLASFRDPARILRVP